MTVLCHSEAGLHAEESTFWSPPDSLFYVPHADHATSIFFCPFSSIQIFATVSPRWDFLLPLRTTWICLLFSLESAGKTERMKNSMTASFPILSYQCRKESFSSCAAFGDINTSYGKSRSHSSSAKSRGKLRQSCANQDGAKQKSKNLFHTSS